MSRVCFGVSDLQVERRFDGALHRFDVLRVPAHLLEQMTVKLHPMMTPRKNQVTLQPARLLKLMKTSDNIKFLLMIYLCSKWDFYKIKVPLSFTSSCLDLHLHITLYATTCAHCCQCVVGWSWDSVVPPSDSASVWISVLSQSLCRVEVTNTGIVLLYLLMKRFKLTLWNLLKCPLFILTHLYEAFFFNFVWLFEPIIISLLGFM